MQHIKVTHPAPFATNERQHPVARIVERFVGMFSPKVPRAYSIDDDGYDDELAARICVYVDGVLQSEVVAYDVDKGIVIRRLVHTSGGSTAQFGTLEMSGQVSLRLSH